MVIRFALVMLAVGMVSSESQAFGRRRQAQTCTTCQSSYYQSNTQSYSQSGYQQTYSEYSQSIQSTTTTGFSQLLSLHNESRARMGLRPLSLDQSLCAEAQQSAQEQARRGQMNHWLPLRGGSENVAMGQTTESESHSSWMRSSGHRANILGSWNSVGFGLAYGPGGVPYWAARYR